MKARTIQVLTASIALTVTILASSDTVKAEFFTNYDISPIEIGPGQEIVTIKNIGWLQADNAVVQITANGTIGSYVDRCVEGEIHELIDNSTLVVKFSRMSPAVECNLELIVPEPIDLVMAVSSDGRMASWESEKLGLTVPGLVISYIATAIAIYIVVLLVIDIILKDEIINRTEFWLREALRTLLHKTKFKEAPSAEKTVQFVKDEYDLKINNLDATVLELIYLQKTTVWQLRNYSKLSLRQVKYRIEKMRRYELVSKEMKLQGDLEDHFKDLT